jgi:hypothetical protein
VEILQEKLMAEEQRADIRIAEPVGGRVLQDAIKAARAKHADWDALEPIMDSVAKTLHADFSKISVAEYVECLYCISRYADFIAPEVRQAAALRTSVSAVFDAMGTGSVQ